MLLIGFIKVVLIVLAKRLCGLVREVAILLLLELSPLLIVQSDIVEDSQVLQEIIFVSVLCEDLKDADHFVVSMSDETVEERNCTILDHTEHCILA